MGEYSTEERKTLLELASASISYGLKNSCAISIDLDSYPAHLQQKRATFVTLNIGQNLRGCIGTLQAYQPLVKDIANNAFAAAFSDPRFPPLSTTEFPMLEIHISILSTPIPLNFNSEKELIEQLNPHKDGLILTEHGYRGTFLPSVWEQLPDPAQFLAHLKLKAGLPQNYWSDTLQVERYTTESFS